LYDFFVQLTSLFDQLLFKSLQYLFGKLLPVSISIASITEKNHWSFIPMGADFLTFKKFDVSHITNVKNIQASSLVNSAIKKIHPEESERICVGLYS
jgi:hypothetical protein